MEFIETILSYASIWAPSIVAMLGVVVTILTALGRTKEAFDNLKKDETLKEVKDELKKVASENEELIRCNKLLLDQITKIKDYSEAKKKEG